MWVPLSRQWASCQWDPISFSRQSPPPALPQWPCDSEAHCSSQIFILIVYLRMHKLHLKLSFQRMKKSWLPAYKGIMKLPAWVGRIDNNFKEEVSSHQNEWRQRTHLLCHCNMHAMSGKVANSQSSGQMRTPYFFRKPNRPWNMYCQCQAATRNSVQNPAWQHTGSGNSPAKVAKFCLLPNRIPGLEKDKTVPLTLYFSTPALVKHLFKLQYCFRKVQKQQSKAEASKAARSPQQEPPRQEAKEVKI